jgi:integrase
LRILAETGLRVGELKWLTWADINFDRNVILVQAKDGWRPKTGDNRVVPMFPAVRTTLESLPRLCDWVVTAKPSRKYPDGTHQISERRLLQYLKRILKKLSLTGHIHTFRHSFISHALVNGTAEVIVREWVGHIDSDTIKLYTHVARDSSMAAMQRLSGVDQTLHVETQNGTATRIPE